AGCRRVCASGAVVRHAPWGGQSEGMSAPTAPELARLCAADVEDHFRNPRNVGELPAPAVTVEASNPACGDILRLSVRFENGVAAEARYKTRGCAASIAAGSALTEWMVGKTAAELARLHAADVEDL